MAGKKINRQKATSGAAVVSKKVKNYEKHPFFVKKKEQAKAFLQKSGLPPIFANKMT
jgi:hypothetical protein